MGKRVVFNKNILGGKPRIAGTRISIELIMDMLAGGWKTSEILKEYPTLKGDDVRAAIEYAAEKVRGERVFPVERKGNDLVLCLS